MPSLPFPTPFLSLCLYPVFTVHILSWAVYFTLYFCHWKNKNVYFFTFLSWMNWTFYVSLSKLKYSVSHLQVDFCPWMILKTVTFPLFAGVGGLGATLRKRERHPFSPTPQVSRWIFPLKADVTVIILYYEDKGLTSLDSLKNLYQRWNYTYLKHFLRGTCSNFPTMHSSLSYIPVRATCFVYNKVHIYKTII